MNARLVKLTLALCSLSLLNFAALVHAQDTNSGDVPQPSGYANGSVPQPPGYGGLSAGTENLPVFDIQIENGKLSLAPLKDREEIKKIWGADVPNVPATIDNLSKYFRAVDPHLNIVLSPDIGSITIENLKLNTRELQSISQAITIASGGSIRGNGGAGGMFGGGGRRGMAVERNLTFASNQNLESKSTVEVFNLTGYIQTLGKVDEDTVKRKINELEDLVFNTMDNLHMAKAPEDVPNFKYHPGTKLLIVIGKPQAIDVTRKIISALSGQQTNGRADLLQLDTPPATDQK